MVYRIAGLPVAVAALFGANGEGSSRTLQCAFARRYWFPAGVAEWLDLIAALILWPLALLASALWFTARNGAIIRGRSGKGTALQFAEQLKLYFSAGVAAPWYYIFSLYDGDGPKRAPTYLQRFETKPALFPLLKRKGGTPLNDKAKFAEYCSERGIRCSQTIAHLQGITPERPLPNRDLFVKPNNARGGRGAERWDLVGPALFASSHGEQLSGEELLERLVARSERTALIVQPRLGTHPALLDLTAGALPTVRIVTCLNERREPELIGAVFRMSIGANRTVDNLHAGGIAAAVDLATGSLSRATNLGSDARLGWLSAHPNTGAQIEGRRLPLWEETKSLAIAAHRAFTDRVVIGWDVAATDEGPMIVEGNGNPDMDILQRFMREGLRKHRFADLLAFHLQQRQAGLAERLCADGPAALHRVP